MRGFHVVLLSVAVAVSACGRSERSATPAANTAPPPAGATESAPGTQTEGASVQLAATQVNTASGSLSLTESVDGVRVTGTIQGLKPDSKFGFHIHEKGDCGAPDASSAGGHFNPTNQQHGNPEGA